MYSNSSVAALTQDATTHLYVNTSTIMMFCWLHVMFHFAILIRLHVIMENNPYGTKANLWLTVGAL